MNEPEVSVEVTGTPEQVWERIATGPGIATWFMPATVEPHVGGAISQRHGDGPDDVSTGRITAYDAPRRFAYEEAWEGRTVATEFLVEARSGGTCVVRIVTHGFSAEEADAQGLTAGWTQALGVLRVMLAAFPDAEVASRRVWIAAGGDVDGAWARAVEAAGLGATGTGERVKRSDPPLTGVVELVQRQGVLVQVEGPVPGVLSLIATGFGGQASVVVDRYVAGAGGGRAAAAECAAWQHHLTERLA